MNSSKIARGLKPVLIEGTNGEFDHRFWLLRLTLEEVIEAFWAQVQTLDYHVEIPYEVTIETGSVAEYVQTRDQSFDNKVFISETSNPEWCFASTVDREKHIPNQVGGYGNFNRYIRRSAEVIEIKYKPSALGTLLFFHRTDYRIRRELIYRWVQRIDGLEAHDGAGGKVTVPGDPGFTGRGVKKLDHDKLYALCALSDLDLTDPSFLRGRFVVQDYTPTRSR